MKVARFVLKLVTLSLTIAAVVCAVVAYWDKLAELAVVAREKLQTKKEAVPAEYCEYDDFVE